MVQPDTALGGLLANALHVPTELQPLVPLTSLPPNSKPLVRAE